MEPVGLRLFSQAMMDFEQKSVEEEGAYYLYGPTDEALLCRKTSSMAEKRVARG